MFSQLGYGFKTILVAPLLVDACALAGGHFDVEQLEEHLLVFCMVGSGVVV